MVLPMFYAIITSLKPLDELWIFPPRFWVAKPTLKNFADLFSNLSNSWVPFSRYIFNTVFISVVGTFGHVIIASMAAYALSKKRFYGSKAIFKVIVTSLMFSGSTAIPTFIIMSKLGFIDTYWSIILPAFSSTLGLYLMKQHMESMVKDTIIEAAKIDGATPSQILKNVTIPMVMPSITICSFLTLTNSFKLFDQNLALTAGEPANSSELLALNIFNTFYGRNGWEGVGQAKAVVFFVIVAVIAITQNKITRSREVQQ